MHEKRQTLMYSCHVASETNVEIKKFSYVSLRWKKFQSHSGFIGSRSHSEAFYGADETRDITSHKKTSSLFRCNVTFFYFYCQWKWNKWDFSGDFFQHSVEVSLDFFKALCIIRTHLTMLRNYCLLF